MFKTLLLVRLRAMFAGFGKNSALSKGKNKASSKASSVGKTLLFIILFGYVAVVFFGMFYMMFSTIVVMTDEGSRWFYFAFAAILSFMLMIFTSVFTAKTALYEATDNELLLSMPVPPFYILASRLVSLFILEYLFAILVIIPAFVVYQLNVGFTVLGAIFFIVGFLLLGLLSLGVICLVAYIISALTRKAKNKSLVTTLFSLAFLGAYFYVYFNSTNILTALLINMDNLEKIVKSYLFPFYHLGVSVAKGSIVSTLIFWGFALVVFGAVLLWLTKSFIGIVLTKDTATHKKYVKGEMKVRSPLSALTRKEIRYFFSVPIYILNCGLGLIMGLGLSVFMCIKAGELLSTMGLIMGGDDAGCAVVIFILTFVSSMNMISACSVSLEGKRLWIPKSLPVSGKTVVQSKVLAHCIICVPPTAISGIILWIGLRMSPLLGIAAVVLPVSLTVLMGYLGIFINLKRPVFNWDNEAVPVKQSMATFLTMLSGFGIVLLLGGAAILMNMAAGIEIALICVLLLTVLAAALAARLVTGASDKLFARL